MAQKINKHTVYWVSLKEILCIWMSPVLYYYINQWSDRMWNTKIPCGVLINKVISKNLKKFKKELLS